MIAGALGAGLLVGIVAAIFTAGTAGGGMMGLAFGLYNPFGGLVLLALIGVGIWYLAKSPSVRQGTAPNQAALDILRERFARGEIDAKEYQDRAEVLRHG